MLKSSTQIFDLKKLFANEISLIDRSKTAYKWCESIELKIVFDYKRPERTFFFLSSFLNKVSNFHYRVLLYKKKKTTKSSTYK